MTKIGLQLYTIKDDSAKDLLGALEKVAAAGYEGVEFAGYYDIPLKKIKATLESLNLLAAGTHIGIEDLRKSPEPHISDCIEVSSPTLLCPYLPTDEYLSSKDTALSTSKILNSIGRQCKSNGIQFLYHIHGNEFKMFDDKYVMDMIIENTNPEWVNFELDTYWVEHAGINAVDYYNMYASRCPYIHCKDFNNRIEKKDTEVGEGVIDMASIVTSAKNNNVPWLIVEQEEFIIPPLESISISLKNLKKLRGMPD